MNYIMSIVNSWVRVSAALCIFFFHIHGLFGENDPLLVSYAFPAFMFLSGFYALGGAAKPWRWFCDRLKKIYAPYLLVCVAVIVANLIFGYKHVSLVGYICFVLGLNMFADGALYVVAWFVSLILCAYVAMFFVFFVRGRFAKLSVAIALFFVLPKIGFPSGFIVWILIGMGSSAVSRRLFPAVDDEAVGTVLATLRKWSLTVQNYAYEFFLLHGGVLLFYIKICSMDYVQSLVAGLLTSAGLSIVLKRITTLLTDGSHWKCFQGVVLTRTSR